MIEPHDEYHLHHRLGGVIYPMTVHSEKGRDTAVTVLILLAVTSLCIVTGPGTFDGMDGAELAVAGLRLEIPHSPGYPLFMWLLRISSGRSYQELRIVTCLLSGLAAGAVYIAIRSFAIGFSASAATSILLVTSGAVLSQLNLLEVHGLSLLLASLSIAFRKTRLGPYTFGMSVFGGHPISFLLLPVLVNRTWLRYWFLGLIPATMWLYVPVRAAGSTVMHYGGPSGIGSFIRYLGMYSDRITSPSLSGLNNFIAELGPATSVTLLLGILLSRFSWRRYAAIAGILFIFLCYGIPDITAYSWLLLLPLSIQAAEGFQTLLERKRKTIWVISVWVALVVSAASGIHSGLDRRNDAMSIIFSDLFRGIPPDRVLCTTRGTSYFCAYMLEAEDMRPDITALDPMGIIYSFSLLHGPVRTIPSEIADRYVYATCAWGDLPPSGILFSVERPRLSWNGYDVFNENVVPEEEMPADMLAEIWCIRALQETDERAASAAYERALEYAASDRASASIRQLIRNHEQGLSQ